MTEPTLRTTIAAGVAWLTLSRPAKLNAFNRVLHAELRAALDAAEANDAVRVVVVTGEGRAFSSGQDLTEALPRGADGRVDLASRPGRPPTRARSGPLVATPDPVRRRVRPADGPVRGFVRRYGWRAYAIPLLTLASLVTLVDVAVNRPVDTEAAAAGSAGVAATPSVLPLPDDGRPVDAPAQGDAEPSEVPPPCVPIAVRIRTSLQCGFKKETAVMRTCAMSRMPRLGKVKPTIFPLIAVVSGNSFFISRTVASRTSASLGTEKCCLISTTEGMFVERGR